MMAWSWGELGVATADLWHQFNRDYWQGELHPCPIWFPSASPYGNWIGLYSANPDGQSLHIQITQNQTGSLASVGDILLHEMIHQYLAETRQDTQHNAVPWCSEIMRLSREIWGQEIWASPALPRKNLKTGKSIRVQALGPDGQTSLTRKEIAGWPQSLKLSIATTYSSE